jgi:hypothetical protein
VANSLVLGRNMYIEINSSRVPVPHLPFLLPTILFVIAMPYLLNILMYIHKHILRTHQ